MNREEKKQDTVNRIIDAALRLFSEKGYEATTVAEIAEAAGVAKGTFFNYFKAKEDLLIKFQKAVFFGEIAGLNEKSAPYAPWILTLIKEMGDSMNGSQTMLRLALHRFLSAGSISDSRCSLNHMIAALVPVFEKGQSTGEFSTIIPAPIMARNAMQVYLGTLYSWSTGAEDESLGDQLLLAFQIFLNGILNK